MIFVELMPTELRGNRTEVAPEGALCSNGLMYEVSETNPGQIVLWPTGPFPIRVSVTVSLLLRSVGVKVLILSKGFCIQ